MFAIRSQGQPGGPASFTNTPELFYGFTVGTAGSTTVPIPEPSTSALMLLGLAGLAGMVRRMRTRP